MERFAKSLSNLNIKTQRNHIRNINKYTELYGDLLNQSQSQIIQMVNDEYETLSAQLTILKSISKFLKSNDKPNDKILLEMTNVNNGLTKKYEDRNKNMDLKYTLRDLKYELKELEKNSLNNEEMCEKYIINYLIINYNVRNLDLDCILTNKLPTDDKHNYLYITPNNKKIIYYRNLYKTKSTYGLKRHTITNKNVINCFNYLTANGFKRLLVNYNNDASHLDRYIIKRTIYNLSQNKILKIILRENNNLKQSVKIGKNRGTSTGTLHSNYNLNV